MHPPNESDFEQLSLGDLVWMASAQPVLDEAHEDALIQRARAGDRQAREQLVMQTLRIAIDEAIRNRGLGEPQRLLVRTGVSILLDAERSYDPIRDGRFSSHARSRVRSAMSQSVS